VKHFFLFSFLPSALSAPLRYALRARYANVKKINFDKEF
jgi:hypothetical protein